MRVYLETLSDNDSVDSALTFGYQTSNTGESPDMLKKEKKFSSKKNAKDNNMIFEFL